MRATVFVTAMVMACQGAPRTEAQRPAPAAPAAPAAGATSEVVFTGACDASGAVPLDDGRLAVADDEDNILRVYDATRGGAPVAAFDLGAALGLTLKGKRNPAYPETDLEAATRMGELSIWLTSHGRNSKGKPRPERLQLFATTSAPPLEVVGQPTQDLLQALIDHPGLAPVPLAHAATLAPKAKGGFNLEGLTARADTGAWIGLRSPLAADGKAVLVELREVANTVAGAPIRLGEVAFLDLGGRGVRSLSSWRGRILIAAGNPDDATALGPALFAWDGTTEPVRLELDLTNFNPEAFHTPDDQATLMTLSDDGTRLIDGIACKDLVDPARKSFRGRRFQLR